MKLTQIFLIFTIMVAGALASGLPRERRQAVSRCPDACITQYDPVCAFNNKCIRVFSNSCYMGIENCNSNLNDQYRIVPPYYCRNFENSNFKKCMGERN